MEHGNQRKPRIKFPKFTQNREVKMGVRKKLFTFLMLKGLGCGGFSSPAVAVQSPAPEKKKKERKDRKKRGGGVPDVCCTPPGIGFTYDVAPSTTPDARRRNHRKRSSARRRVVDLEQEFSSTVPQMRDTSFIRSNAYDTRRYNRLPHRFPRGISEIVMFEHNLWVENLDGSDRFGEWRLNIDIMSYEELVELSDKIGNVDAGLQEEEILSCIKRPKQSFFKSFSFNSNVKDTKCSICQEECKGEKELGRLECGHYHHLDCIKQWLLQKNTCPVCKSTAKSTK